MNNPPHFPLIILSLLVLIGLLMPSGLRAAVANNLWSIKFIKDYFSSEGNTSQLEPPPSTMAHAGLFLTRQLQKEGDVKQALDHILPLVESSDRLALDAYANLLYLQEDYQSALALWKDLGKTLTLEKAARDLQGKKLGEPLIMAYQSLYEIDPEKYVAALTFTLKSQGKNEEAIALLEGALQRFPASQYRVTWHRYLGDTYYQQGKFDQAEIAFRDALRVEPQDGKTWRNLKIMYDSGKIQDDQRVLNFYLEYVKAKPDDAGGYLQLGKVYEKIGQPQKALVAYQIALQIDRDVAEARQGIERLSGDN